MQTRCRLAMPDLDLIKQGEQVCGIGAEFARAGRLGVSAI